MAESWFIRGEGGSVFKLDLPLHEAIEQRLHKGYLVRVNKDGTDWTGDTPERVRPPMNAPKIDWVAWAVHNGELPDDAEALTKTDLIEKYS
jgi:hypothetical protein